MGKMRDLNILKNFNILYVEDDADLLTHTKDVLEDFVHEIFSVQTTAEAFNVLQNEHVDVVICDILLKNENGIDFLKSLHEKNIELPAILTTAHTDTNYLLDAIKLKVEGYIVKPISIKELLNNLYDVLLPQIQQKDIQKRNDIIKLISLVTDNKQVDVIKYIIQNLDEKNLFVASYKEIMDTISISKPTLIKLFKQFLDSKILTKTDHKTYRFDAHALDAAISKVRLKESGI
jgi:DNA-binding NtrC family response regulator